MKRREAIGGLIALGAVSGLRDAHAQARSGKPARIGFLGATSSSNPLTDCFLSSLRDAGWIEGKTLDIEYRWADGIFSRYQVFGDELARLPLDVIVAGGTPAVQAMQRATRSIPVVMFAVSDPVASGVVASLARPGGNITGVSNFLPATTGKLIEFLKLAAPRLSRFGVLHNPDNAGKILEIRELRAAAQSVRVSIQPVEVHSAADFDRAFASVAQLKCEALLVLQEGVTFAARSRIAEFAAKSRLPAIYQIREFVDAGGLMSYGLNYCHHYQRAAYYVDRILKGARPGELPVELPTSFELVINRKAANALGLSISQELILRANEVIG